MAASALSGLFALSLLVQGPGEVPAPSPTSSSARQEHLKQDLGSQRQPRTWFLDVKPGPGNPDDAPPLHRQLAERLTGSNLAPPSKRIEYYNQVNPPNFPTITGWEGLIEDVRPIAGGHVVTLRVFAKLEPLTHDSLFVRERYAVTNRGVQLIGFEGPPPGTLRLLIGG